MKNLLSLGTGGLALLAGGCERALIYYPSLVPEAELQAMAHARSLARWEAADSERIGWMASAAPATAGRAAVVVFHGNAGHAVQRDYFVQGFRGVTPSAPWDVFLFEYPGYGDRAGRPSEEGIKAAARAAMEPLFEKGYHQVFLAGESLGGGVACHLAARYPHEIDGLLLVTPFTTLGDVARHHYPNLLVRLLLRERYDNVRALQDYRGRLAVLLAERDEVVPAGLGRQLYESYAGPKKLWIQEGRTHNTLSLEPGAPWWRELTGFLQDSAQP